MKLCNRTYGRMREMKIWKNCLVSSRRWRRSWVCWGGMRWRGSWELRWRGKTRKRGGILVKTLAYIPKDNKIPGSRRAGGPGDPISIG